MQFVRVVFVTKWVVHLCGCYVGGVGLVIGMEGWLEGYGVFEGL